MTEEMIEAKEISFKPESEEGETPQFKPNRRERRMMMAKNRQANRRSLRKKIRQKKKEKRKE